jgi:hypothetical protein
VCASMEKCVRRPWCLFFSSKQTATQSPFLHASTSRSTPSMVSPS